MATYQPAQFTTGSLLDNPYVVDIVQSSNSIQNASGTDIQSTLTAIQQTLIVLQDQITALDARIRLLEGS
jgi:hypothetical protein